LESTRIFNAFYGAQRTLGVGRSPHNPGPLGRGCAVSPCKSEA
jgi:hypothetical protein